MGRDMSKGTKPAYSTAPRTYRHLAEKEESGVTWLIDTGHSRLAATTNAPTSPSAINVGRSS